MDAHLDFEEAVAASSAGFDATDRQLVERGAALACTAHEGQWRRSGDPYITHPANVAVIARRIGLAAPAVAAAWLHDVIEDTPVTLAELKASLGDEVAGLVEGLTKLDGLRLDGDGLDTANLWHLLIRLGSDPRVVLVKLCDRLHNLRTIDALPQTKQRRIAAETMAVFAPLAHRMGLGTIRAELEDRCFEVLEPHRYAQVATEVEEGAAERDRTGAQVLADLERRLAVTQCPATLSRRSKHLWSIAQKANRQQVAVSQLRDLIGIRVVVDREADCYRALQVVHQLGNPVPGTFKDYIATPKFAFYQSLHTVVVVDGGHQIEVQIRSQAMHDHAETGAAAHWRYKRIEQTRHRRPADRMPGKGTYGEGAPPWAVDLLAGMGDSGRDELAGEIGNGEVFVFTPRGDLIRLPHGACPVDAAYAVHTEVGDRCLRALVNGRPHPLTMPLSHGDRFEIVTGRDDGPDPAWLDAVVTGRARTAIRLGLRRSRHEGVEAGRRRFLSWREAGERWEEAEFAVALGYDSVEDFLVAVLERRVSQRDVRAAAGSPLTRWSLAAGLVIEAVDRAGLLAQVVAALASVGADITASTTRVVGQTAHQQFQLRVDDTTMLDAAVTAVGAIDGVEAVTRDR